MNELLYNFKNRDRFKTKIECSGNSVRARRNFWNHVSSKVKDSSGISAVVDPETGCLHCNQDEIVTLVEKHLCTVFMGDMEPVPVSERPNLQPEFAQQHLVEHSYASKAGPKLVKINDSCSLRRILLAGRIEGSR